MFRLYVCIYVYQEWIDLENIRMRKLNTFLLHFAKIIQREGSLNLPPNHIKTTSAKTDVFTCAVEYTHIPSFWIGAFYYLSMPNISSAAQNNMHDLSATSNVTTGKSQL